MKKLILSIVFLLSVIASFGQVGSITQSGVFTRVNDSTTYQSAAATKHAQGYSDIYYNNQATVPHYDIWDGSAYQHVFTFGGSGGGGSQSLQDVITVSPVLTAPVAITSADPVSISTDDGAGHTTNLLIDPNGESYLIRDDGADLNGLDLLAGYAAIFSGGTTHGNAVVKAEISGGTTAAATLSAIDNGATNTTSIVATPTTLEVKIADDLGSTGQFIGSDGSGKAIWATPSGSGTVDTGTAGQIAVYSAATTVDGATTGTGVVTALGVNTGSAGAFVVNGGAGGTPSSLTLTNATGLPFSGLSTGGGSAFQNVRINAGATAYENFTPLTNPSTTTGDLIQWDNGSGQYTRLAAVATGNVLRSGGTSTAASWGKVNVTTDISGTIPVANGGTGLASFTIGDLMYASGTTTFSTITAGAAGTFPMFNGAGAAPITSTLVLPNAATTTRLLYATGTNTIGTSANLTFNTASGLTVTGSMNNSYAVKTTGFTVAATDYLLNCTTGSFTATLPTAVGIAGRTYIITNSGSANTITIATNSSQTFNNVSATPTSITIVGLGSRTVVSDGAGWLLISSL